MTTWQHHRASPYNAKLLASSVWGGFLYLLMPCFLWGSHGGVAPTLTRPEPPAVLAVVPVCCSANPPVLASRCATSMRLSDSAVCREGFSHRHGNWFILPSITHPSQVFDWPALPSWGGDRARDYGMRNHPGEKGSLSMATSQLIENPAEFFTKTFFSCHKLRYELLFGFVLSGYLTSWLFFGFCTVLQYVIM